MLSNLRSDKADIPTGHSEDGMVVRFTLAKYNDDSVRIVSVGLLPTWVVVHGEGEERDFCILPLDSQIPDWQTAYGWADPDAADDLKPPITAPWHW